MWVITATVTKGGITKQVPTFYLDENVQGIRNEQDARSVAMDVIDPMLVSNWQSMNITAVKV